MRHYHPSIHWLQITQNFVNPVTVNEFVHDSAELPSGNTTTISIQPNFYPGTAL